MAGAVATRIEPTPAAGAVADARTAAPLHACARPLIALATQLRTQVPADPEATHEALASAVEGFEARARAAGFDERSVSVASYLLCSWLDEASNPAVTVVRAASLLERFHHEPAGGARLFALLERLAEREVARAGAERPLLELAWVCLSLGLQGPANDARTREVWRVRLAGLLILDPAAKPEPLSPHWRGAVSAAPRGGAAGLAVAGLLLLGLATFGVFGVSQWLLARQTEAVFASLQSLEQRGGEAPRPGARPVSDAPGRLAASLAAEARQQGFRVRDEGHRSVITWDPGELFEPDTTRLASARAVALGRIAEVLEALRAQSGGRVLVTAYADADSARPSRLPSAWDLADEWARHVAQALEQRLPAGSVGAEGRTEPGGNRIEIVLFP